VNIRIIKLLSVFILAFGVVPTSFAVANGAYFGLQAGMSQTKVKSIDGFPSKSTSGVGGGLVIGNQFAKYFAAEFFVTHFANARSSAESAPVSCGSSLIHTNATGIAGRGIVPIGSSGLDGYLKLGAGFVRSSGGGECPSTRTTSTARPIVGLGVSYAFTQTMVGDLSATYLPMNSTVKSSTLIALGISYHFVDIYCGQFLC